MTDVTVQTGFDFCDFLNYDKSQDFVLDEIGTYICPPSYSYGPLIRPRDIIHYIYSGKGKLIIEGKEYLIHEGQGFLIPAGKLAYYEADAHEPWSYCWLHVGGNRLPEIISRIGLSSYQPLFIPMYNNHRFEELFQELIDVRSNELLSTAKLYELFDYMISNSATKKTSLENMQVQYVRKIVNFIQVKYSEPIQVNDIAVVCGLDRSYMTRLFKEATGETIQNYLIQCRINHAKYLLESTQDSIQHISLSVGYSDIFVFSKAFKKITGYSPSQWRKMKLELVTS